MKTWASVLFSGRLWRIGSLAGWDVPGADPKAYEQDALQMGGNVKMGNWIRQQSNFYEKLSERLKEKGFSTRIIEDGCLEVTSEKIRGQAEDALRGRQRRRGITATQRIWRTSPRKQRFEHCMEAVNDL